MGAAAGFGQSMGGQTGVGSSSTQSNAPTGGKGGGMSTPTMAQNPYASTQPQQAQPQPYQPMGGNVFGYNMTRLARQMDPSATLPTQQPQQTPSTQTQQPAQTGGKGGGQPGIFGIPQEFEPFAIDAIARSYGYQPYEPSFFQPQQGMPQQQEDPFDRGYDPQAERMAQLERQLADLTSRQQTQAQEQDTGEVVADLPEAFEEFGVGETPQEVAAEEAATQPNPDYEFTKRVRYTPEQLANLKRADIRALYKADIKKQQADVAELRKRLKAATTPEEKLAIRKKLDANIASVKGLKKEMNVYAKPKPSSGGVRYAYGAAQPQTAEQRQATRLNPLGGPLTPNSVASAATVASPTTPKPPTTTLADVRNKNKKKNTRRSISKAAGGVIHTGMTSNLKKQLGIK